MSQSMPRQGEVNVIGRPAARQKTELETTAQFLLFEPGLYSIDFTVARSVRSEIGLRLPCIRLEPLPAAHYPGRAFVSFAADGGWLSGSEEPAFVLVVGGQAGLVMTVYKMAGGMVAPEIRIRALSVQGGGQTGAAAPAPGPVPRPAQPPSEPADPDAVVSTQMIVLAHVRAVGDVTTQAGEWAGRPASNNPVEGFAVTPTTDISGEDIEYQAVLGHNWNTPWFRGGEYCGSRGLALPLLGFRARLTTEAAERFDLRYWGSFVGGGVVGPIENGLICTSGEAPLEALRFVIVPRTGAAPSQPSAPIAPTAAEGPKPVAAKAPKSKVGLIEPVKPVKPSGRYRSKP